MYIINNLKKKNESGYGKRNDILFNIFKVISKHILVMKAQFRKYQFSVNEIKYLKSFQC